MVKKGPSFLLYKIHYKIAAFRNLFGNRKVLEKLESFLPKNHKTEKVGEIWVKKGACFFIPQQNVQQALKETKVLMIQTCSKLTLINYSRFFRGDERYILHGLY